MDEQAQAASPANLVIASAKRSVRSEAEVARYESPANLEGDTVYTKALGLIGSGKSVLELGCATGYFSRLMREQDCGVVAIEIDPRMAKTASSHCNRVIVGDLDQMDLDAELGTETFDVAVTMDVLEHLKNPAAVLKQIKKHLTPEGCVVASLPNVAHASVRLGLLAGEFRYEDKGLLDRSHLHFYTRQTLEELFEEAGFAIGRLIRQFQPLEPSAAAKANGYASELLLEGLSADVEAQTYQFVLTAFPILHPLELRAEAAEQDAAVLRREIEGVRREVEAARKETEAVRREQESEMERLRNRERELRTRLIETHDALIRRDDEILALRGIHARAAQLEHELAGSRQTADDLSAHVSHLEQIIRDDVVAIKVREDLVRQQEARLRRFRRFGGGSLDALRRLLRLSTMIGT